MIRRISLDEVRGHGDATHAALVHDLGERVVIAREQRSSPSIGWMSSKRACLTALTFGISASRASSSFEMSTTQRDGML